jgi:hypothetical protein
VATKKNIKTVAPAAPIAKTPSPREKLKIKTKATEEDWYQAAFKRFSISQNRIDTKRGNLASLTSPTKPGLE